MVRVASARCVRFHPQTFSAPDGADGCRPTSSFPTAEIRHQSQSASPDRRAVGLLCRVLPRISLRLDIAVRQPVLAAPLVPRLPVRDLIGLLARLALAARSVRAAPDVVPGGNREPAWWSHAAGGAAGALPARTSAPLSRLPGLGRCGDLHGGVPLGGCHLQRSRLRSSDPAADSLAPCRRRARHVGAGRPDLYVAVLGGWRPASAGGDAGGPRGSLESLHLVLAARRPLSGPPLAQLPESLPALRSGVGSARLCDQPSDLAGDRIVRGHVEPRSLAEVPGDPGGGGRFHARHL